VTIIAGKPTVDGKTAVKVISYFDPKGNLPHWVVNQGAGELYERIKIFQRAYEKLV
jgi:hypothetical protein